MAQPQKNLSNILEFDGGDTGVTLGAIEVFIAALSLDDAINVPQLMRIMSVSVEAENLNASERLKVLGWIRLIEQMRARADALKRGELGP